MQPSGLLPLEPCSEIVVSLGYGVIYNAPARTGRARPWQIRLPGQLISQTRVRTGLREVLPLTRRVVRYTEASGTRLGASVGVTGARKRQTTYRKSLPSRGKRTNRHNGATD